MAIPASQNPNPQAAIRGPGSATPGIGQARPAVDPHQDPAALGSIQLHPAERAFLDRALSDMTQRERDVVYALCEGGTNEEMARRLSIALPTLRTHLMRLNQKLRTTSKSDVVRHIASVLLDGYRTDRIHTDRF